jgi:hypothetical protein
VSKTNIKICLRSAGLKGRFSVALYFGMLVRAGAGVLLRAVALPAIRRNATGTYIFVTNNFDNEKIQTVGNGVFARSANAFCA